MNPSVAERGVAFARGNQTSLEPGQPGTFGVERRGDTTRIVWYFNARDQTRAFTVSYTLRGVAVAYDDVVDVNLKVWGDQWEQSLFRLVGIETAPGKILRAWGKPVWVRGDVEIVGTRATLRAVDVPAEQFVELRTLIPRTAFTSTTGMRVERGNALDRIVAGGARGRRALPDRSRPHRRAEGASHPHGPRRARARDDPGDPRHLVGLLVPRARATDGLRPRVRAGAPDRHRARARSDALASGRRGRLVRVHGDAVRPRPPRRLQGRADDDREAHLGRAALSRRSPTSSSRPARIASCARGSATWPTSSTACSTAAASGSRASATRSRTSASRCTVASRRSRARSPTRRSASRGSDRRERSRSCVAVVLFAVAGGLLVFLGVRDWRPVYPRYSDVLLVGIGACLIANAALVPRDARVQPPRLAATHARRAGGGGALGGVPPLSLGLPAPAGSTARRRSSSGSATSSTASPSGSPSACSRARSSTCRRRWPRRARSTGSHRTATSARARRASRSAISRPASGMRSHLRTRAGGGGGGGFSGGGGGGGGGGGVASASTATS